MTSISEPRSPSRHHSHERSSQALSRQQARPVHHRGLLYFQQDYERSRQMLETVRHLDPDFPPALNLLGYSYIQTGTPDLEKAVASVQRYAEVQPKSPNPRTLSAKSSAWPETTKVLSNTYSAALNIDPTITPSHYGLGDTSALMGNYLRARAEYDDAIAVSSNPRDRSHCEFQKALVYFLERTDREGHAALDALNEKARRQKEPYSQFEIGFGAPCWPEMPPWNWNSSVRLSFGCKVPAMV